MARASPKARLVEYRRKRDFARTPEPRGTPAATGSAPEGSLRFVIQKHKAGHLHFDLRLELDGVMKSWAVPKGPSTDPSVKRLAMQVEDHPIEYNEFEGTIPAGQYGGGTVMLWDTGTYSVDGADGDDEAAMRERYRKGDIKVTFHGERLRGSFALVRMKPREPTDKPAWLLIKHRDGHSSTSDVVARHTTSVTTGRTMEEIAGDDESAVWNSDRAASSGTSAQSLAFKPMLATIGTDIPTGDDWTFEPKYDGIRVLAYCTRDETRLVTRNGRDKALQFPEIAAALRKLASSAGRPLVLDGEIIAVSKGKPGRFQGLQGRIHLGRADDIGRLSTAAPAAIAVFDLLLDGEDVLVQEPWEYRRKRLEQRVGKRVSSVVLLAPSNRGDGFKLLQKARAAGWEGLIAKRTAARYEAGVRSRSWLKLKAQHQQEFVVGGWTEPRQSRQHLGAILLGYFDEDGDLIYAGHTGGGFSQAALADMHRRLKPLERKTSPFTTTPKTNERPHWTEPKVVAEVQFNEWTSDGRLRQPIFLGVRTDKPASSIRREPESVQDVTADGKKPRPRKRKVVPRKRKVVRRKKVRASGRE